MGRSARVSLKLLLKYLLLFSFYLDIYLFFRGEIIIPFLFILLKINRTSSLISFTRIQTHNLLITKTALERMSVTWRLHYLFIYFSFISHFLSPSPSPYTYLSLSLIPSLLFSSVSNKF